MASEFKITKIPNIAAIKTDIHEGLEQSLDKQMALLATEIVERTQAGQDARNGSFKPYSPGYTKLKAKKGRRTIPDLTFTGNMLSAITHKVYKEGANLIGQIFFNSAKEADKATWNQKTRQFFALSAQQISKLASALNKK